MAAEDPVPVSASEAQVDHLLPPQYADLGIRMTTDQETRLVDSSHEILGVVTNLFQPLEEPTEATPRVQEIRNVMKDFQQDLAQYMEPGEQFADGYARILKETLEGLPSSEYQLFQSIEAGMMDAISMIPTQTDYASERSARSRLARYVALHTASPDIFARPVARRTTADTEKEQVDPTNEDTTKRNIDTTFREIFNEISPNSIVVEPTETDTASSADAETHITSIEPIHFITKIVAPTTIEKSKPFERERARVQSIAKDLFPMFDTAGAERNFKNLKEILTYFEGRVRNYGEPDDTLLGCYARWVGKLTRSLSDQEKQIYSSIVEETYLDLSQIGPNSKEIAGDGKLFKSSLRAANRLLARHLGFFNVMGETEAFSILTDYYAFGGGPISFHSPDGQNQHLYGHIHSIDEDTGDPKLYCFNSESETLTTQGPHSWSEHLPRAT